MSNRQAMLEVRELKTYFETENGWIRSVDGVTFTIERGEVLGVIGESGCGKSVTSYSVMGLVERPGKIVGGAILFEGTDMTKLSRKELRKLQGNAMSMIFQEPLTSLNPLLTVGYQIAENIRLHQSVKRGEAKRRSIDMLRKVGIPRPEAVYRSFPHELSGGMRQRVMIATALSCNPKLLIADEPTTALDVTIQAQILRLMKQMRDETGSSILLITHDLGVIAEMVDRVIVMYAGQVVEEAEVHSLFQAPKHPYTLGLIRSTPRIDETRTELDSIPGAVPPPSRIPVGCRFHPRCAFAMPRCAAEEPPLQELASGTRARCWLHEEGEVQLFE
ncbi:ABC transporter ATP-binding protein [Paenibacillus sp. TRM 82003]|nr:ABC transporter ATP-binding protein [Paenibacillus sp. TRM 82003]